LSIRIRHGMSRDYPAAIAENASVRKAIALESRRDKTSFDKKATILLS